MINKRGCKYFQKGGKKSYNLGKFVFDMLVMENQFNNNMEISRT